MQREDQPITSRHIIRVHVYAAKKVPAYSGEKAGTVGDAKTLWGGAKTLWD